MTQSTTAIFENGNLKPTHLLERIPDHSLVRVTVEAFSSLTRDEQLDILKRVPVAEDLAAWIEAGRNRPRPVTGF